MSNQRRVPRNVTFVIKPGVETDERGPTITIYHPRISATRECHIPCAIDDVMSGNLKYYLRQWNVREEHVTDIDMEAIKAWTQLKSKLARRI